MNTTKRLLSLLFCAALLSLLLGCGESRHAPDEVYYLVGSNLKLHYWQTAKAGFLQGLKHVQVRGEAVGPETYDPQAEKAEFQRLLSLKVKPAGILVSPADPELMKSDIDAAISAGIPVLTFDSDSPSSSRFTFIGTNNYQAGQMAARVAVKLLQGKGNLVVMTMPNQANLAERLQGYRSVFADHPQIKITEVIDMKGDPTIVFDTTKQIVEKRRDQVDGFICLEAAGGNEVAEILNRNKVAGKLVMAFDSDEETLEWIRKGVIAATVAQKPFTMAFFGVQYLDSLHHGPLPSLAIRSPQSPMARVPAFIDTGATLIDKGNVEEFARQAQASKGQ